MRDPPWASPFSSLSGKQAVATMQALRMGATAHGTTALHLGLKPPTRRKLQSASRITGPQVSTSGECVG